MKRNPKGTKKQLLNRLRATRCYLKARREELESGAEPTHGYKTLKELDAAIALNQKQIDVLTGKVKTQFTGAAAYARAGLQITKA